MICILGSVFSASFLSLSFSHALCCFLLLRSLPFPSPIPCATLSLSLPLFLSFSFRSLYFSFTIRHIYEYRLFSATHTPSCSLLHLAPLKFHLDWFIHLLLQLYFPISHFSCNISISFCLSSLLCFAETYYLHFFFRHVSIQHLRHKVILLRVFSK